MSPEEQAAHPRYPHLVELGLAALVTFAAGCTSWSRLADSRPVPSRGLVQVWRGGDDVVLLHPQKVGDSLVGLGPWPDTTRQAVALTTIDSFRVQTADPGKVLIVGTGVAIAVVLSWAGGLNFK